MKTAIPGLLAVVLLGTMAAASAYTLEGEVFAFETGPIPNASVNLWVQLESGSGYSYWWKHGPLSSNDLGLFEAPYLPYSHVSIDVRKDGYVQPCAVTRFIRSDVSGVRVELMPVSAFDVVSAPRPQLAVEPSVTGVVYETTATGRRPIAGARVWLVDGIDNVLATTMSDRSGGYFVCNLPTAAWLTVSKDGFKNRSVGPVNSSETRVIDIELMRQDTLSLSKSTVAGCRSLIGKLQLANPAPAGGRVVSLSSTLTSATTPASVTVPGGATTITFPIKTTPVTSRQTGTITANFGGTVLTRKLSVRRIGMLSVRLDRTRVVGTKPAVATAELECEAAPGPIMVNLASSNAAIAYPVAASIVVPQGLQSAPFDIATSKVLSRQTASISATANGIKKAKTLTVTPASFVSPTSLQFGTVPVGATSSPRAATLTNKGNTSFTIGSIGIAGTNPLSFEMAETCPTILAAGASCSINVRFKPTAATTRFAKLSIATGARLVPLTVWLSGTGT